MKLMQGNQRGFTLVEVMVGVLIMALVGLAAAMAIIQVVNAGRNSSHMSALRQVQTAGYWVSRDGLQAQDVLDSDPDTLPIEVDDLLGVTPGDIEILILRWTDWDDGDVHQVVYFLRQMYPGSDLDKLRRQESIYNPTIGEGNLISETTTMVAQYIDGSATSCYWTGLDKGSLNFEVTATLEQQTESRTYEIKPRPEA